MEIDIETLKDQRFFALGYNEELLYEHEADGFVIIIGIEQYELFKDKVRDKLDEESFYFSPRGLAFSDPDKEKELLLEEYSKEFLKNAIANTKEISFEECKVLNRCLGTDWSDGSNRLHYGCIDGTDYRYFCFGFHGFYWRTME